MGVVSSRMAVPPVFGSEDSLNGLSKKKQTSVNHILLSLRSPGLLPS